MGERAAAADGGAAQRVSVPGVGVRESGASGRKGPRSARPAGVCAPAPGRSGLPSGGRGEQVWRGGQYTAAGDPCGCRHAWATRAAILGPLCTRLDPHARNTVSAGGVLSAQPEQRGVPKNPLPTETTLFSAQPGWLEGVAEGPGRQHEHAEALFWNPVLGDKQVRRREGRVPEQPSPAALQGGQRARRAQRSGVLWNSKPRPAG